MQTLTTLFKYDIKELVLILVSAFLLIKFIIKERKESLDFLSNWTKKRNEVKLLEKKLEKSTEQLAQDIEMLKEDREERRALLRDTARQLLDKIDTLQQDVQLLKDSDKDDIKSYITSEFYRFSQQGWIDSFSLDCLERRYDHYIKEDGNSFIKSLMQRIRKLPIKEQEKK